MKKIKSKLEEEINAKKGREISNIISDMHLNISVKSDVESPHNRGSYVTRHYKEIIATPGPGKDKEENDKYFIIFRDILSNSLRLECKGKDKDLSEEKSFIYLAKLNNDGCTYNANEKLGLKEYLDIIEGSESFIGYISGLVGYCRAKGKNYHVVFDEIDLDDFLTNKFYFELKYLGYIIDIKKIEYKDRYLYSRPKLFKDIELLWRNGMYDKVIDESRNALIIFVDRYERKHGRKGLNVKKAVDSKKFDNPKVFKKFFKSVCSDYPIKGLTRHLNKILEQFRILRNEFGKAQPNHSLDNQKIPETIKKINARMIIDLAKTVHNILVTLVSEKIRANYKKETGK